MFLAARDSRRGVVRPAIVLAGVADVRSDLGILLHPAPPIGFEESAEFFRGVGLRVRVWPLRFFCRAANHERQGERCASDGKHCERANHHGFLPAAMASSFSRSRASKTMRRAVSAASIAVLSISTASLART